MQIVQLPRWGRRETQPISYVGATGLSREGFCHSYQRALSENRRDPFNPGTNQQSLHGLSFTFPIGCADTSGLDRATR